MIKMHIVLPKTWLEKAMEAVMEDMSKNYLLNILRGFYMKNSKIELSKYDDFRKYTIDEIAEMLGIGKTKAKELLKSKLLPVTKIGRDYFTSRTAIQEFLTKNIGKELYY